MAEFLEGSCLCEAVTFTITLPHTQFVHCYCSRCRKVSGTSRASNILAPADQLEWNSGEDLILRFDLPEAQSFANAVCRVCLTRVPHVTRSGRSAIVPAGAVDTPIQEGPGRHVHWESRCAWALDSEADLPHDP